MPLVWNLPEWLLPVNHPFCLGQELKQFYPWIWWIQRHAATLWRTKVMNFPFSFIYFSNLLKNGTDAFSVMQTNSAVLSRKWMAIPTSCCRTLVGQGTGKTLQHLNIDPKKKMRCSHFYFFILLPLSTLLPLMRRWACLEFREPILLPDWNFPQSLQGYTSFQR